MSVEEHILRAGLDSSGFERGGRQIERTIFNINSAAGLLTRGLATLGVALSAQKIIQVNTEFERLKSQLVTVTGSARNAQVAFDAIEKFATETPFQLSEVVEAFTQLKARGLDPSMEALTAWGDLASSMGRSVGDAIRAVGAATVGEMEALKSFGVQAVQNGDKVSFTFKGMTETVTRDARSIEAYLMRLAQNNFGGSMERQSKTLGGAFSNLEDAVAAAIRKFGEGGFNDALRDAIKLLTDLTSEAGPAARVMGSWLGDAVREATSLASYLADIVRFIQAINGESEKVKKGRINSLIPLPTEVIGGAWDWYSKNVGQPFAQGSRSFLQGQTARLNAQNKPFTPTDSDAERAEIVRMAREREVFSRDAVTSASPQLQALSTQLQRQALFSRFVGPQAEFLKAAADAQTGLSDSALIDFVTKGVLPQAGGKVIRDGREVDNPFTTGSRDALMQAWQAQRAANAAELGREYKGRDIGIQGSDARTAAISRGDIKAAEEATAMEKARQAVLRDGRDLNKELEFQRREMAARNKEDAAQRLEDIQRETRGTQTLLEAVRAGVRDTSEFEARNQALAEASKNSAVNVEELTEAILKNARAQGELDYERQIRQLNRTTEAAGQFQIRLNEITQTYEVYNREAQIAAIMTDDLIKRMGVERAREFAEASVDAAEAQRRLGMEAERTRTRIEAGDWTAGAKRGLMSYQDTALNMARNVENLVVNSFQSMEDALVKFVQTGKLDFKSLADSIIADLIRIQIRQMMTQAIGGAGSGGLGGLLGGVIGGLFGGGGAAAGAAGAAGGAGTVSTMTSAIIAVARGGVFNKGNVIPYAQGGINYSPKYFPMADGNVGLWGEAGPEAIMPLGRDSSGRLGVRAHGGFGGGYSPIYNIDARGSQVGVERLIREVIRQEEPSIRARAVNQSMAAVTGEANRGGRFSKTVGRRL